MKNLFQHPHIVRIFNIRTTEPQSTSGLPVRGRAGLMEEPQGAEADGQAQEAAEKGGHPKGGDDEQRAAGPKIGLLLRFVFMLLI
jgi:hypothetical protein